jgi:hypothetical protein
LLSSAKSGSATIIPNDTKSLDAEELSLPFVKRAAPWYAQFASLSLRGGLPTWQFFFFEKLPADFPGITAIFLLTMTRRED